MHYPKLKILFIHIPKCAGTSITKWLNNVGSGKRIQRSKHFSLSEAKSVLDSIENYTTITCIRNPYDRLVSGYFYYKRLHGWEQTFEQFVKSREWHQLDRLMCTYFDNVDILLRYETLQEDFKQVRNMFTGRTGRLLSNHNRSSGREQDYRLYYTPELVDIVYKHYKQDIELFGYSF